jgi:fumarylacetoacetate (FAA) hydrolase
VRLVGLLNDWRLCPPGRGALAPSAGAGVPDQAPAGWAPVLVTPDELGGAWRHGRLALQVEIRLNGQHHARLATDEGMPLPIGSLLAALARQRPLTAGTLLSSGAIGHDAAAAAPTPLQDGDVVRIEAFAADGQSVFGAIAQTVVGHD